MATTGLIYPYYAKYRNTGNDVEYYDGGVLGKAISFTPTIEVSEDNDLWADNGVVESDGEFIGGTIEVSTDDLSQKVSAAILGLTPTEITVGSETVSELRYNDDLHVPYLGFGTIFTKRRTTNGIRRTFFRAVVLTKIMFNIPAHAATTRAGAIEWQVPTLTARVFRDDTEKHDWQREAEIDTETLARAYVKQLLNITTEDDVDGGVQGVAAYSAPTITDSGIYIPGGHHGEAGDE